MEYNKPSYKISIASVVTKSCLKEFLLLKYSCEQFNNCKWFISCDEYSSRQLSLFDNIKLLIFNESDSESDHNSNNKKQKEAFLKIILNKFSIIEEALKTEKSVLFLDSDMLFVGEIEKNIINLLDSKQIDFITSPHYTNNLSIEHQYGFYNVGMFGVNEVNNLTLWKNLTIDHEKLNLYFEQKPFELILKNYFSISLPINYNIGWWRFNQEITKNRLNQLHLLEDKIYFGNLKAINFHFHVFKEPNGYNPGKFLVDLIFSFLKNSNNEKYKNIVNYHEQLSKTFI